MARQATRQTSRRTLLKQFASGAGLGVGAPLLAGCRPKDEQKPPRRGARRPLRAAFSGVFADGTTSQRGREAATLWGKLLDVDVRWLDVQGGAEVQREQVESILEDQWDFCAFEAPKMGTLEEPVGRLAERGVPVISMGTPLVERDQLRDAGVWLHLGADQIFMAENSAQYLVNKIDAQGKLVHVGGGSEDPTAQKRQLGFENVVSEFPELGVIGGVQWCGWDAQRARETFEALLEETAEPIAGAFFHSDEMALACVPALNGTRHASMVVTAVDGQQAGLAAVRDGKLAATVVEPTGMIYAWSLIIGQFIVRGGEQVDDLPMEVICPSPLVAREIGNIDAMLYLADPSHCLI